MRATEPIIELGCVRCPYSGPCPSEVKFHYSLTLRRRGDHVHCLAYQEVNGSECAGDVLTDIAKNLPVINMTLGPSD